MLYPGKGILAGILGVECNQKPAYIKNKSIWVIEVTQRIRIYQGRVGGGAEGGGWWHEPASGLERGSRLAEALETQETAGKEVRVIVGHQQMHCAEVGDWAVKCGPRERGRVGEPGIWASKGCNRGGEMCTKGYG